MHISLLIAAFLFVLLAAAHSYLGERYILIRLFRRTDLPKLFGGTAFTQRTLRFAWHITSVCALGFAALLYVLARPGNSDSRAVLEVISATSFLCGLVALIGSRARHLSWIVFLVIAALTWWGK